jgi:hypothetical protein
MCHTHNAIADRPNNHAGHQGEHRRHDQGLKRVDPMKDDNLIDCIQNEGDEKHLAGNSPQVSDHDPRLRRITCKGPKEDRPTFAGIRPSCPDRKDDRYYGLDNKPDVERTAVPRDEFVPSTRKHFFHALPLPTNWPIEGAKTASRFASALDAGKVIITPNSIDREDA